MVGPIKVCTIYKYIPLLRLLACVQRALRWFDRFAAGDTGVNNQLCDLHKQHPKDRSPMQGVLTTTPGVKHGKLLDAALSNRDST